MLSLNRHFLLTIPFLLLSLSSCSYFSQLTNSKKNTDSKELQGYAAKVRGRLIENVPNYRFCLEKFLTPDESGSFKGAVTFSFEINKHGTVRDVMVISDQLKNLKAKGCLIKVISMMEMPKHNKKKNFKVRQPMGISMQ